MLVKRKEEFALYQQQTTVDPVIIRRPEVNKRLRVKCLILVGLFAVMAMFTTIRSEIIVSEGYALVKLNAQADQLEKDNERLKLEIAQMKAPQRIKQLAIANLGMVMPEEVYFASKSGN